MCHGLQITLSTWIDRMLSHLLYRRCPLLEYVAARIVKGPVCEKPQHKLPSYVIGEVIPYDMFLQLSLHSL